MTLGEKLFNLRTDKNLKQEQVAYELEIVQSTYSDWENDVSKPKKENVRKAEVPDYQELVNVQMPLTFRKGLFGFDCFLP